MCGIAAVVYRDPARRVDEPLLRAMLAAQRHRGPDGEGVRLFGRAGIGHVRLAILDLPTGAQPMSNEDGTLWVTFNGEIYNFVELRDELAARGHRFRTKSDTEVLLHLYEELGPECLHRLNGMFAFAIWDDRAQTLFCARDRFGIKPLYYADRPDLFAVASEAKALLAVPGIAARADLEAVNEYITFQFCLGSKTLFDGIRKLEPGHALTWRDGRVEVRRYWDLSYPLDLVHDEEHFVRRLRELLTDSVRLQLRSDVPLGCTLSGGLDSSSVTMVAASLAGRPLDTFTGTFREGPEYDETPHARRVAEAAGARYHEVVIDRRDFLSNMERLVYHLDEPVAGPGAYPQMFVAREARRHVNVCLGGRRGGRDLRRVGPPCDRVREAPRRCTPGGTMRLNTPSGRDCERAAPRGGACSLMITGGPSIPARYRMDSAYCDVAEAHGPARMGFAHDRPASDCQPRFRAGITGPRTVPVERMTGTRDQPFWRIQRKYSWRANEVWSRAAECRARRDSHRFPGEHREEERVALSPTRTPLILGSSQDCRL